METNGCIVEQIKPKRTYNCRICGQPKKNHICVDTKNILDSTQTIGYFTRSKARQQQQPVQAPTPPRILQIIHNRAIQSQVQQVNDNRVLEEGEYEVEEVIHMRKRGRGYQILVKWVGYDELDWIPYGNTNCDVLILEYFYRIGTPFHSH